MRCDLTGIKCWTTFNSSPKTPLHSQNLFASYTCSNLFPAVKVENVMTSCSSWPWELPGKSCLQILQAQSNFLRKCLRRGEGSRGIKQALCPKPICREWHRILWKFLSGAEKAIYHGGAQGDDAAHGSCVTVFIARHFPYPAITSQTETTLPWPKAWPAFCQPK